MLKHFLQSLITWYLGALKTGGFALVALLMAMESSFLPLPSEFIIPPAAHLAWTDGLDLFQTHFAGWTAEVGVVIAGALGSWLGATTMYWLVRAAGRPLVHRYGKFYFVPAGKIWKSRALDVALRRGGHVRRAAAARRAAACRHPDRHRKNSVT